MGEFPKVRYYNPRSPTHEAAVLSKYLARFVNEELENYAGFNRNFPPQSNRPPSVLIVTDRSMDLMAPLVHEFTYQAMAHDLLPIDEREKVLYRMTVNEGTPLQEEKDMELQDNDKVWIDNRHRHMKDTIDKLMSDFQKFLDKNPHFAKEGADSTNLNVIRDMLAGLPQFQEMKEIYSLHLTMAQECMNKFQHNKLPDIASVEQTCATGLDEDYRRPKGVLDEVVRLLDDDAISPSDRLRLIIIYILYRDGVILEDIKRLLAHASLPPRDGDIVTNLELLGARPVRGLKESRQPPAPLFPIETKNAAADEEYALSRFDPVLKPMLEELCKGTLDQLTFPYVNPPADPNEDLIAAQGGSLRAGRPNWAAAGRRPPENRQRVFVYMAGGATYSESRVCYDVSARHGRDIFLITSHMLTPALFLRQVNDLSADKRRLDLPWTETRVRASSGRRSPLLPRPATATSILLPPGALDPGPAGGAPAPPSQQRLGGRPPGGGGGLPSRPVAPPTGAMGSMTLSSGGRSAAPVPPPQQSMSFNDGAAGGVDDGGKKHNKLEKKRRNFLGLKK
ncbi:hypothetical protein jhhlp_004401 [Lomentospora prolificans]|uniref:Sec1-like protein n=1 Tax=Lomentospora prolificans TaxID=41688 RepID=A0A2N3NBH1_9PEZI|nr:hypothetical protein jhhlp_004401 [Lomentospora prolificans]